MREKLRDQGDLRDWKTLRRLLSTHMLATTSLTLEEGRVLHLRKPSIPDAEQAIVYQQLGIDWKAVFPTQKTGAKERGFVVPFGTNPRFYEVSSALAKYLG